TITPSPPRSCISRAPVNSTASRSGTLPLRSRGARQVCAAGSIENCCGVPVASACARVKRRLAAMSFAAERICIRSRPPPRIPTASTPAMAISATTASTSIRENPGAACAPLLLDPDVRIHALAPRLPVRAVADDVEAPALAGHPELEWRIPWVGELGFGRIRAEPAAHARRLYDEV